MNRENILTLLTTILLYTILLAGTGNIHAQSNKKILKIGDVELWRNNSVTLSDDGNWYTVIYSLVEEPR